MTEEELLQHALNMSRLEAERKESAAMEMDDNSGPKQEQQSGSTTVDSSSEGKTQTSDKSDSHTKGSDQQEQSGANTAMSELLSALPGVDLSDPDVLKILASSGDDETVKLGLLMSLSQDAQNKESDNKDNEKKDDDDKKDGDKMEG